MIYPLYYGKCMHMKKILKTLLIVILAVLFTVLLIYLSLQSDFAKVNSKKSGGSADAYKVKTKYSKDFHYPTKFQRSSDNDDIVSLGYFNLNVNNGTQRTLMMKVSVETEEGAIEKIMNTQSVIRNDVIDSVMHLKSSKVNPSNVANAIQDQLNKRLKKETIKEVYFEEFIIQ